MKKIIAITSLVAIFAAPQAFAKTEGNYASADVLYNRGKFSERQSNGSYIKSNSDDAGWGLSYKHAFNRDKTFVAPGVFGEINNSKVNVNDTARTTIDLRNRYGLVVNAGYDLEDDLAAYLVGGWSFFNYKSNNNNGEVIHHGTSSWFYGVGLRADYSERVSFSLEYNTQTAHIKGASVSKSEVDYDTVKLGLNYKF